MFRKDYLAFQRPGGYNTMIVDMYWRKAPRFAVKLPGDPSALTLVNPYPDLQETWYEDEREWGWTLGPLDNIPDLGPALCIAERFHPSAGPAIGAVDREQVREQLKFGSHTWPGLSSHGSQARLLAGGPRRRGQARERARSLPGHPAERCDAPR